jgi:hypothetical protein
MEQDDQKNKISFSKKGAWLGLIAYMVLIMIVAVIFIFG